MSHNKIINACCAECGVEGGISLKSCKSCMQVKYCNAICQHKHWPKHKKECKQRAAELRDEALFKDPPPKEECPICFLPMPTRLMSCVSLPPATIHSVPVHDFAYANFHLTKDMEQFYTCCGKSICQGCVHSSCKRGNPGYGKCPFCNAEIERTTEQHVEEMMRRVEANDPASMCVLGDHYFNGLAGFQRDRMKAIELFTRAGELGLSKGHYLLADLYRREGDLKKAKFYLEAAAMAGNEMARYNLGILETSSGNKERAVKHWTIAASAGCFDAMNQLRLYFKKGYVTRESMKSTLKAYNNSCVEMRSEARDGAIRRG